MCVPKKIPVAQGDMLSVGVAINGLELQVLTISQLNPLALTVIENPQLISIQPILSFVGDENIVFKIEALNLLVTKSLSCNFGGVFIQGSYYKDENGTTFCICVLPSHEYLITGKLPQQKLLPSQVTVEISNDGQVFSNQGLVVGFIPSFQIKNVFPSQGPSEGNTLLTLTMEILPQVNNAQPNTTCVFQDLIAVKAVYINSTTSTCVTPPLNQLLENKRMDFMTHIWVNVKFNLSERVIENFYYLYTKQVNVNLIEQQDISIYTNQQLFPYQDKYINLIGTSFLKIINGLVCRQYLTSQRFVDIPARYLDNHTVTCFLSAQIQQQAWQSLAPGEKTKNVTVELSLNYAQQFTFSKAVILLRQSDFINTSINGKAVAPPYGYNSGGQVLKINYRQMFSPDSKRARCVFIYFDQKTGLTYDRRTTFVSVDKFNQIIQCFTPPIYLITPSLQATGGYVQLFLTSNGMDLSENYELFLYKPNPIIDQIVPNWMISEQNEEVFVYGKNFFEPDSNGIIRLKTLLEPSRFKDVPINFYNNTLISLYWPSKFFFVGEQIKLSVTFEGNIFITSIIPLNVYNELILGNIRPSVLHQVGLNDKPNFIYAETLSDLTNLEPLDYLRCRFKRMRHSSQLADSGIAFCNSCPPESCVCTAGTYLNRSMMACPVPRFQTIGLTEVDIQLVAGYTYSITANKKPIYINIIEDPSQITLLKNNYFETDQRVFLNVTGLGWGNTSQVIYVRTDGLTTIANGSGDASNSSFNFEMDWGMIGKDYNFQISLDGGMTFFPKLNQPQISIKKCPAGSFCDIDNSYICPPGFFCPQITNLDPIPCPKGFYSPNSGSNSCIQCPPGTYCPDEQTYAPRTCSPGQICAGYALGSRNQLEPCPTGFYCPLNQYPILCPDGYWCPEGSMLPYQISGNSTVAQKCKSGVVCQNKTDISIQVFADPKYEPDMDGAISQFGKQACPPGYFCVNGIATLCKEGQFCGQFSLSDQRPCLPGSYSPIVGGTKCSLSVPGTFSYYHGQNMPYKCKPGYTCNFAGIPTPVRPCPAGSYCKKAVASDISNATLQLAYHPIYCFAMTYCLWGVYTPVVDSTNPQAAQMCIAGTFCGEGSDTPEGKGKCSPGYYCPPNSPEAMPAPAGYFCAGGGNIFPMPCNTGTYQSKPKSSSCEQCPIGYFCGFTQMLAPQMCPAGTYANKPSSTVCANCPEGTYSDQLKLTDEAQCKPCESKYVCLRDGLISMYQADLCTEGYMCPQRTTSTIMMTNPSPSGYYTAPGASSLEDSFLCSPKKYCAQGTSFTKQLQNDCLPGFFCPLGTSASLNLAGNFNPGIKQINKSELIKLIKALLVREKKNLADQDINYLIETRDKAKQNFTKLNTTFGVNRSEAAIERSFSDFRAANWAVDSYNNLKTYVERRENYLAEISMNVVCDDDLGLPQELIDLYFQGGLQLKCPMGTTSERGSYCLGQCTKPKSAREPVSILDPIDPSKIPPEFLNQIDEVADENQEEREMQVSESEDPWQQKFDTPKLITLKAQQIAKVNLDFRNIPEGFKYNEHFGIVILGRSDSVPIPNTGIAPEAWEIKYQPDQLQQQLPDYFADYNDIQFDSSKNETKGTKKRVLLELKLYNYNNFEVQFRVCIYLYHGLFRPYLRFLENKVGIEIYQPYRQTANMPNTYGVLIAKKQLEGIVLPYNMPNVGAEPLFYIDMTSLGKDGVNKPSKYLKNDVFDTTFWDSKQIESIIMGWIPYFSNCEGFDSHIVLFDLFERGERCKLVNFTDIRVVNPIPLDGTNPVADECQTDDQIGDIICRYDENLLSPKPSPEDNLHWYELITDRKLFYVTRDPIPIDKFYEWSEIATNNQTIYIDSIQDQNDDLIQAHFFPQLDQPTWTEDGKFRLVPTLVEINFQYNQIDQDVKQLVAINVYLKDYQQVDPEADPIYKLRLSYKALGYFSLINQFQFSESVYFVYFLSIALILIIMIIVYWMFNLCFSIFKESPSIRFTHLVKVTFLPPISGALLSFIPSIIILGTVIMMQMIKPFNTVAGNWNDFGSEPTLFQQEVNSRGRVGLVLTSFGIILLSSSSQGIIKQPTEEEEEEILQDIEEQKRIKKLEESFDQAEGEENLQDEENLPEQDVNIKRAIDWKRNHFMVVSMITSGLIITKLQLSFTIMFKKNIYSFLAIFTCLELLMEQLLTRIFVGEALLLQPLVTALFSTEYVTSMAALDFQTFIIGYLMQIWIIILFRSYVGPYFEKIQMRIQQFIVRFAQKNKTFERIFKSYLLKTLQNQIELLKLAEQDLYGKSEEQIRQGYQFSRFRNKDFLETTDGTDSVISSLTSYSCQVQTTFIVPLLLVYIKVLQLEIELSQAYQIKFQDLNYYLFFCVVTITPKLIADVFLLHIIEILHGFKLYDYLTYSAYKFKIRKEQWTFEGLLDCSISQNWRSIDKMCFSSQYYFITGVTSHGILLISFGLIIMINQKYNVFSDPVLIIYVLLVQAVASASAYFLEKVAKKIKLWEVPEDPPVKLDFGALNRLDKMSNARKLARNIQANPFRHKFVRMNRDWLIHNIAMILGGKDYIKKAGPELQYLTAIYQRAVNAEAIEQKMQKEHQRIQKDLAVMPYNARAFGKDHKIWSKMVQTVDNVSDDSVSDLPPPLFVIPPKLSLPHVQKFTKVWLNFARQNIKLKTCLTDIVVKQQKNMCQICRSIFRLQVIQKVGFNQMCAKYASEHQGIQFSFDKWRRFYTRNQVFLTLCMECAYIDNVKSAHLQVKDGDLQRLMAINTQKNIGREKKFLLKQKQKAHVMEIVRHWILLARENLANLTDKATIKLRKEFKKKRLRLEYQEALKEGKLDEIPLEKESIEDVVTDGIESAEEEYTYEYYDE